MIFKLKKLFGIFSSREFFHALLQGAAAGVEHISLLRSLGQIKHVVDIGANRGQFALAARHCFPQAKIDSFEPLSEPSSIFKTIFSADINVVLHEFAIGPRTQTETIYVSRRDDSSSLLPIGHRQTELFPSTAYREARAINASTLQDVLSDGASILQPALMKIDVQGFELEVLKGCQSLLNRFEYMYIECSFVELYDGQSLVSEVFSFLFSNNFLFIGVRNICNAEDGSSIQGDFLFRRRNPTFI